MKKTLFPVLTIILFAFLTSCGPTKQDAINYNDKIIAFNAGLIKKTDLLDDSFSSAKTEKMNAARDAALKEVNNAIKKTEELGDFDGKSDFKDAALKYFNKIKTIIEVDYKKLIVYFSKDVKSLSDTEKEDVTTTVDKIQAEMSANYNEFSDFQKYFAKKHDFMLTKK